MRKKRFLKIGILLTLLSLSCSCSKNQTLIAKENVESLSITGELLHTQYWNKNDNWDLKGLSVYAYFTDGTSHNYSFSSKCITYSCVPEKPIDGIKELKIINVCYVDHLDNIHLVCEEVTYSVSIVDYPYEYAKTSFRDFIVPIIVLSIVLVISTSGFLMYRINKRKRD